MIVLLLSWLSVWGYSPIPLCILELSNLSLYSLYPKPQAQFPFNRSTNSFKSFKYSHTFNAIVAIGQFVLKDHLRALNSRCRAILSTRITCVTLLCRCTRSATFFSFRWLTRSCSSSISYGQTLPRMMSSTSSKPTRHESAGVPMRHNMYRFKSLTACRSCLSVVG